MRPHFFKWILSAFLVLSASAYSQKVGEDLPQIPDSLRNRIENADEVISIKEARDFRNSVRGNSAVAADTVEVLVMPKDGLYGTHVNPLIVGTEVLGLNAFVWAWDYWVLDKDYAHTGPSYWKRNFREGWEWDHNHWAINFYGHPYQGSMYYATARASGYGFYGSMVFAGLNSSDIETLVNGGSLSDLLDTLAYYFPLEVSQIASYYTAIPTRVVMQADWDFAKHHRLSAAAQFTEITGKAY